MNWRIFSVDNPEIFQNFTPNNSQMITWDWILRDGLGIGIQVKHWTVVVEVLHLHGDCGAGAQSRLGLLLGGHHHQQELSLVGVLEIQLLKWQVSQFVVDVKCSGGNVGTLKKLIVTLGFTFTGNWELYNNDVTGSQVSGLVCADWGNELKTLSEIEISSANRIGIIRISCLLKIIFQHKQFCTAAYFAKKANFLSCLHFKHLFQIANSFPGWEKLLWNS